MVDDPFDVRLWPVGTRNRAAERRAAANVPDDAPAWWEGDEEAAQSFLRSMGVQLPNE